MRIKVLGCEVMYREICYAAARSPHTTSVQFLPRGLHDGGSAGMRARLQNEIDSAEAARYDAVVLGYALCGNGTVGLVARGAPLVIPRAHDCITLLMGSRHAFETYFDTHPGVYYRSTGWLERGTDIVQLKQTGSQQRNGAGYELDELIAQYGEDNGRYLYEQLGGYRQSYTTLTFIETGIEPNGTFEQQAEAEARSRGWRYEKLAGSMRWFEAMLAGDWAEEDFLVVPPGYRTVACFDSRLIDVEKAS
ncbi:MAG TPA: DUF1638 domain-containing protein [Bryobacteraceae bacterium]|nr:DUF1638 domain-containing protein [Bryobacteraceae bacterium]